MASDILTDSKLSTLAFKNQMSAYFKPLFTRINDDNGINLH